MSSEPTAPRTSTHRRGNWRSLILSMALLSLVVFAVVALQPRPAPRARVTVDVERSATQLAATQGWPLLLARPGDGWHPTLVELTADTAGVPTWRVGYHSTPGDEQYVVLSQTQPAAGVDVPGWIARVTRQERADGTVTVAGAGWERRSATIRAGGGDRVQRSLVRTDGPLVTVLSGEVEQATLERFAGALGPAQASSSSGTSSSVSTSSSAAPAAS